MQEAEYRDWLASQGKEPATLNASASTIRRIEAVYGNLESEFSLSGLEGILSEMTYSKSDQRNAEPNPSKLQFDGDVYSGLASARTHLNYYRRFLEGRATQTAVSEAVRAVPAAITPTPPDSDAETGEAVLSLERDLNAALRQSITQLEPGLSIIDAGRERSVPSGRIDILAEDAQGRKVVIELKAVKAPRDAIAQVLAYMGDISAESGNEVRGFLIAPDFDPRALAAARMVPSLVLKRFTFQFAFETAGAVN